MEVILEKDPQAKVYSENAFFIATILGGPLAAVYMYIANTKVMGLPVNLWKIWALCIAGFFLILLMAELLQIEGLDIGIAVGFIFAVRSFVRYNHAPAITKFLNSGGQTYPIARSIVVGMISLLATSALIGVLIL
jgi:hypothetical protein